MKVRNYQDLIVWQKAMDLVEQIYAISQRFPREEIYGLTSQLWRSWTTVKRPSVIARGVNLTAHRPLHTAH